MKLSFFYKSWVVAGLLALLQTGFSQAQAADIAGLFSTGASRTNGQADLHYSLIQKPAGAGSVALLPGFTPSSWMVAPSNTSWLALAEDANQGEPAGSYVYRLTFSLEDMFGEALNPEYGFHNGSFRRRRLLF